MNRRSFLKWTGGAAATAAVAHRFTRPAHAAAFGEFPVAARDLALPENVRAKRVLEIFCYGGLSSWETLYLVRKYGSPGSAFPGTQFHAFDHSAAITGCQFPTNEIG
ncbi:MAG: twin-arginine translocation signal domain-containing protein, partial [Deltaproteobacteria bacterium]|nr:twin-arginine translocation signal domain-containing protein [Deltaproteobacteria bacterium]